MRPVRVKFPWLVLAAIYVWTPTSDLSAQERESSGFVLEEITVTARRRAESLQDTPIAISVLTANDLNVRQVQSADQLADITPNVTFDPVAFASGRNSAAQIYIRGIGQTDFTAVTDPGVGLYIDGVYFARSIGAVLDFLDVDQVQILRGPQGTLFGRNTIGGAILVNSRKPSDEMSGSIKVEIGSDSKLFATGYLDLPFSETLKSKFAVSRRVRDGYVTRVTDGEDFGDDDTWGARAAFLWTPTENFEAFVTADYTKERENGTPIVSGGVNDLQFFASIVNFVDFSCGAPFPFAPPTSTNGNPNCANETAFIGEFKNGGIFSTATELDMWGVGVTLTWDVSDLLTIESISAYRDIDSFAALDVDGTPHEIFATHNNFEHHQFSQELQFSGTALDDRLKWLIGLYYFEEEATDDDSVLLATGNIHSGGFIDNDSAALFGQATYDVTDRLSLTFGLRRTEDTKRFTPDQFVTGESLLGPFGVEPGSALTALGPQPIGTRLLTKAEFIRKFDDTSAIASIAYKWTDNILTYFSFSEGFKSGGFDQRFEAPVPSGEPSGFEPEFATSYELGFKTDLFENRLRLNAAFFHTDYEDLQIVIRETFNPITFNGGEVDINGFELEGVFVPNPNLMITAAVGYIDAEYVKLSDEVINNPTPILLDNKLVNTPEFSTSLGVAYTIVRREWGTVTPRFDWSFHGESYNDAVNSPQVKQDSYHMLNAAVIFESPDGHWEAMLAGRNLLDETYVVTGNSAFDTGASFTEVVYGRPAEWAFSVKYNF